VRRFLRHRLLRPAQEFVQTESSGGLVLVVAAAAALAWANSPWGDSYRDLWVRTVRLDAGVYAFDQPLSHVVSEGLMALFFFVIGLEIKREFVHGELATRERAALPVVAAIGGMVGPACVYAAFNAGGDGARGWGIPMATDIAFALGVLTLLGPRIPFALKVFLLALAVVDDLGAIAVIAVFYAEVVAFGPLLLAGGLLVAFAACVRLGVRWPGVYVALGLVCWLAVLESGVHATVAGVLLALLVPAGPRRADDDAAAETGPEPALDRLERRLHPWVSYGVVPLFAFASAGVELSGSALGDAVRSPVAGGVAAGLVAGKPAGILLFAWLAVRARVAHLPRGVSWRQLSGAAVLAGIGFTVSLFVTGLAFGDAGLETDAKLGILAASLIAGVAGYAWLRAVHPVAAPGDG